MKILTLVLVVLLFSLTGCLHNATLTPKQDNFHPVIWSRMDVDCPKHRSMMIGSNTYCWATAGEAPYVAQCARCHHQ